jgi:hypothetical protein
MILYRVLLPFPNTSMENQVLEATLNGVSSLWKPRLMEYQTFNGSHTRWSRLSIIANAMQSCTRNQVPA